MTESSDNPNAILGFGTWAKVAENQSIFGASSDHLAGSEASAGLPNITGSGINTEVGWKDDSIADGKGAFFTSGKGESCDRNWSSGSNGKWRYYDFDASRSNPIYGNSNTVQPPARYVNIWKRTN